MCGFRTSVFTVSDYEVDKNLMPIGGLKFKVLSKRTESFKVFYWKQFELFRIKIKNKENGLYG